MTFTLGYLLLLFLTSLDKGLNVRREDGEELDLDPVNSPVTASEGETVRLNCTYTRKDPPLPENPTVIWKDHKGHTISNTKGVFYTDLKNLTQNDSGRYECHIRDVHFQQNIYLNVTGRKMKKETPEPKGGATVSHLSVCFITALFACYFFI